MEYEIRRIRTKEEIITCRRFEITNYMWRNVMKPKVYGQMGYIEGEGFFVQMTCEESKPKRTFVNFKDPVYQDSAMEAFLAFLGKEEALSNDVMYVNFEVNPNAAMYAAYGKGRKDRKYLPESYLEQVACQSTVEEERWSVSFLIPEVFLREECGIEEIGEETRIYCNFYKISESKEVEHYGSFSKIESETPNFHLPLYFAEAVVTE